MNPDDMLREAVAEEVLEVLDDPRLTPEEEVERLKNLVESAFWTYYAEQRQERESTETR